MIEAEKIESNFNKHLAIIKNYIKSPRKEEVLGMVKAYADEYVMAPASTKSWYHNAFAGGYVDHVNRVVEYAIKQLNLYKDMQGTVDFTEEELVFAALFHDLGKLGYPSKPNYLVQTDKWRQDKLAEKYTNNSDLDFMLIQDRSLFILQTFGIKVNFKEYLAIRTHDGVFDDANKPYFFSYQESSRIKSNIVHILHSADYLASKVEYDLWKKQGGDSTPKVTKQRTNSGKTVKSSPNLVNLVKNM